MRRIWSIILLGLWIGFPMGLLAQTENLSVAERNALQGFNDTIDRLADDFVTVSLVIADPGQVLYSTLGHAALRLQCPIFNLDYIFTYESEGIDGKVFRFLCNDLKMGMIPISVDEFLASYIEEGRGVKEYILNLPPEIKTELWRMCDERVDEGMLLNYDPVKRGCAISVLHSVEEAVKSANRKTGKHYHIEYPAFGKPFERTLREIFYDNAPHGWGLFFCMTLVGGIVDEPNLPKKEKLICPKELAEIWSQCTIDNKPLICGQVVLNDGRGSKPEPFTPMYASLVILLLSVLGLFMKNSYCDWIILGIQTLLGALMLWLLIIPLPATGWSWLIIPFNILPIIFWHWRRYWAIPYASVIVVWCIVMMLWPHRLVEYAHLILAISFTIVLIKQKIY